MALWLYNDLGGRKEEFQPLIPGKARMYVCGMTVYDYCHIGHARVWVVFDLLYRWLMELGYQVDYVRNITDIDDKIIQRANERGESFQQLTERFIAAMHEDAAALGVLLPSVEPRATGHLDEITAMTRRLIERGHAYLADNGDVYFSVRSFPGYGKLSGKSIDDLESGARVEPGEAKRDPLDFALWKASKPGEPAWQSPWGDGRPGWHIECSAMSTAALGDTFDIHGGGMDLTFPHHENEIAQSEGATGKPFVRYWLHNGFVRVRDEKMSKSLGNFFTVRDILKSYRPEVLRYFLVASHYRSPVNYDDSNLENAQSALNRFYTALRGLPEAAAGSAEAFEARFRDAMNDDLNTPEALAVLFDLAREVNRLKSEAPEQAAEAGASLRRLGGMLGLLQDDPEAWLRGAGDSSGLADAEIELLITERRQAREQRNWKRADEIRDTLKASGVVLEDGAQGTSWRRE